MRIERKGCRGCRNFRRRSDWTNHGHKKTLNLAIQGFRYLVPETESNIGLQPLIMMGMFGSCLSIYSQIYSLFEILP